MTAHADARAAIQPLPRASLLLLAAAVMHMVIGFATQQMTSGYLDLAPGRLVFELRDAMPFVLAAALVAGWDRWPAGRGWLVAAAIAFAGAATLRAAAQLWFGLSWPPEAPPSSSASVSAELLPVLAAIALPFGPLLAAIGLWRARQPTRWSRSRLTMLGVAVVVATVILVVRVLLAIRYLGMQSDLLVYEPFSGGFLLAIVGSTVGGGMLAVLGVAALWAAPRHYLVPEALITVGALAAAVASISAELGLIAVSQETFGFEWIGWTAYAELLGLLVVALGFLSARISVPGEN